MRLRTIALPTVLAVAASAAGWFAELQAIPYVAQSAIWNRWVATGYTGWNQLRPATLRKASRNRVPMANADSLQTGVMIDVGNGPVVFTATPPSLAEYWSISVFGHNTDTLFVVNDQAIPKDRPYRLIVKSAQQSTSGIAADAIVTLPSRRGQLLVRTIMRDPADAAHTTALARELERMSVQTAAKP